MNQVGKFNNADSLKLILSVIAFLIMLFTIALTIPAIILIVSAVSSIKSGNISYVKYSTRFIQALVLMAALIFCVISGHSLIQAHQISIEMPTHPANNPEFREISSRSTAQIYLDSYVSADSTGKDYI